jgi:probable F420-dependent oxidoreductase
MGLEKVGVTFHPQHTTMDRLREGWRAADALGVDSIWTWDHFYPLYGDADGPHFEAHTMLTTIACDTTRARFGALVTCNSYRNPELLADMARTVDHVGGGRFVLGIGAGWFQRDYDEYGYEFGTGLERLERLESALPRIKDRLAKLDPPPVQASIPILIGGGGEKVTLRIVAEHADAWNGFGPVESWARKNAILDEWCEKVGRDPSAIERTVLIDDDEIERAAEFVEAGAQHLIVGCGFLRFTGDPFDLAPLERLVAVRDA